MKNIKMNIGKGLFLALGLTLGLGSCEDMLSPESDLVTYPEDNQLNTPNDTLSSMIGILHLMQNVAERQSVLGEVRGDLISLTNSSSADLRELYNFNISEENAYNKSQDYYAIINNCNYYIQTVDSGYTKQGVKVFERELAQMHSYRAWAYLQLCMNYGTIPFFTDFLDSQLEGQKILEQPGKSIKEVCNWLIEDLIPWQAVKPWSITGSVAGNKTDVYNIPVRLMLGELCLWAERYEEAAQYYHDFLADQNNPHPLYNNKSQWYVSAANTITCSRSYSISSNSEILSCIPMERNVFDGVIPDLVNLYCSTKENNYFYEITYSESAVEQSANQRYTLVYYDAASNRDTTEVNEINFTIGSLGDRTILGDLRLYSVISVSARNNESNTKENTESLTNRKHSSSSDVTLFRNTITYLHYAEALNRAGYPTAAFAVLKYGLCDELMTRPEGDPVAASEREKAGTILDFSKEFFDITGTNMNTLGVHQRGSGDVDCDTLYVIPELATANDTMLWVEDKLIEEMSLETIFEGHRFYDLMRVALRRNDPDYLASRVAARNGKGNIDTQLQNRLQNSMNWYLPMKY